MENNKEQNKIHLTFEQSNEENEKLNVEAEIINPVDVSKEYEDVKNKECIDIETIIDNLGFHRYNILMMVLVGMTLFSDGIELFTVYLLIPVLYKEFHLSIIMKSLLSSSSLLGNAVGNAFSEYLYEKFGERKTFLVCNIIITVFGLLTVVWVNMGWFLFCRFIIGFAIGINYNHISSVFENLPEYCRHFSLNILLIFINFGAFFYTFLFLVFTQYSSEYTIWRTIVGVSTIPMILTTIFNIFFFEECSRTLLINHEYEKLFENLDKYSGKKNFLSESEKAYLIKIEEEKEEINKENEVNQKHTFLSRVKNAFKLHRLLFCLLVVAWIFSYMYNYCIMYNFTTILDQKPYKEVLIEKQMAGLSIINEFYSNDMRADYNYPKDLNLIETSSKMKEDVIKMNNYLKSNTQINSKTNTKGSELDSEEKEYIQYADKYKKVLLVEGVCIIGLLINCFIHHTDWPKAPIYLIIAIIGIVLSGSKLLAIQYAEYFVAVSYTTSKAGISFVVSFVCDNYHTDHMGPVFIFFSCFSSFFLVFCPFIMNGLLIDGFYSPNYFILFLAIVLIILFVQFILIEKYYAENNKEEEEEEEEEFDDTKDIKFVKSKVRKSSRWNARPQPIDLKED
jgi:MFS family permease